MNFLNRIVGLITLTALVFYNSSLEAAAVGEDEVVWSSYDKGFCKVTVQGFEYPPEEKDSTLPRVKALTSLYQGLQKDKTFNPSPNIASMIIYLDVEFSGERHTVSFPVRDEGDRLIYFSSSNRGVYGREFLPDLYLYLLEESPKFTIYSYADLSEEAEEGFVVKKGEVGAHSEELMLIYINSKRYGQSFWRGVIKQLTESYPVGPLIIRGSRVAIHSWWDVCTSCQSQLRDKNRLFCPSGQLGEGSRVILSDDYYTLFSFFSEMPYGKASRSLSRSPEEVSIDSLIGFAAARRKSTHYEEVFNILKTNLESTLDIVAPPARLARRARLVGDLAPEKPSREVLRAITMIYTHPVNIEVLLPREDSLARFFNIVSEELWQFSFAHQYRPLWRKSLTERLESGDLKEEALKYSSFLLPYEEKKKKKKINPSLLLLSRVIKKTRGEGAYLSELQKKWFKFRPIIFGFPHFGWKKIAVVEVEEGLGLSVGGKAYCQMCGNPELLNLHQVRHKDAKIDLFVGSECVRSMTLSQKEVLDSMQASCSALEALLFPKEESASKHRLRRVRS